MNTARKLWLSLIASLIVGLGVLLLMGRETHRQAPQMPQAVVAESGATVYTRADIEFGRRVWQSIGGQQLGSIWGHGALVAPDWSADWLRRDALAWFDLQARSKDGVACDKLDPDHQACVQAELRPLVHLLVWMRVPGDTVYSIGALLIAWFVLWLWVAPRRGERLASKIAVVPV